MNLVTVKTSHYPADLYVLRSVLESEGVECFISGELNSQVLNYIPSMQAELKVLESDIDKVNAILKNRVESGGKTKIVCPECGSDKYIVKFSFGYKLRLFIRLLISAITFTQAEKTVSPAKLICRNCKAEFTA